MVLVAKSKRPAPAHQKKRTGQHHRVSKHYSKTYWPYLPLVVIVALGVACNVVLTRGLGSVLGDTTGSMTTSELLRTTNAVRADNHERPLTANAQLARAAQAKAQDMAQHDYWAHNTPDGMTPWSFMRSAGYSFAAAGENLAYGFSSAGAVTTAWMSSPEHKANLLQSAYQNAGFGVAQASHFQGHGAETIVVALYAEPAGTIVANSSYGQALPGATTSRAQPQVFPGGPQDVAQLQMLGGNQTSWMIAALTLSALAAGLALSVRHVRAWHKVLVRGESFLLSHPVFDIVLVTIVVAAAVLTRVAGSIY